MFLQEGLESAMSMRTDGINDEEFITLSIIQEEFDSIGLSEEEREELLEDFVKEGFLSEKVIVKLDKKSQISQATTKAAIALARQNNDPLYKLLIKAYSLKKKAIENIKKKYATKAGKVAKDKKKALATSKTGKKVAQIASKKAEKVK